MAAKFQDKQPKTVSCLVHFLDETQVTFDVDKRQNAQQLLDKVFEHLKLVEKDYFGIQFLVPGEEGFRWLDPLKSIRRQCSKPPYEFFFRVKFYVSDPSKLAEEYTRYLFFLQVRKDILSRKLVCNDVNAALLASYAVQSELGDFNPDEHKDGYLHGFAFIPEQTKEFEQLVAEKHREHKGQTPADAEFNFLERAKGMEMYGVFLFQARDKSNEEVRVGVNAAGVVVFQNNNVRLKTFPWPQIVKISYRRRQFTIQLQNMNDKAGMLVSFNVESYRSCKKCWQSCVEHHNFFRLREPPPKEYFSDGLKLIIGRTQYQALEDIKRRTQIDRPFPRMRTVGAGRRDAVDSNGRGGLDTPVRASLPQNSKTSPGWKQPDHSENGDGSAVLVASNTNQTSASPGTEDEKNGNDQPNYNAQLPDINCVGSEGRGLATIKMKPDDHGCFGFKVSGGADEGMPVIVSRVAPGSPAGIADPPLNLGDQVLVINGNDVSQRSHEEVVTLIEASRDKQTGELTLVIRPYWYVEDDGSDTWSYVTDDARSESDFSCITEDDEEELWYVTDTCQVYRSRYNGRPDLPLDSTAGGSEEHVEQPLSLNSPTEES